MPTLKRSSGRYQSLNWEVHGWDTEILIVDNGSTDGTAELARAAGARVLVQPVKGYGNAYKAGFANADR